MGGMCDEPITAATQEEMMSKGVEHLEEVHPEMATQVKEMPKDDPMMVDWNKKFNEKWDATPEEENKDQEEML